MDLVAKLLLGKLIDVLVKYAEKKFTEASQGETKKAYVLSKISEVVNIDDEGIDKIKDEITSVAADKIEEAVAKLNIGKK